jgi:UDPglucose 6-dehydrogenase
MNPDRIVVGCEDEKSLSILSEIYKDFDSPIHSVSLNTAEFTKYLSNALLSTMISYANEMSMIGYAIGDIDIPSAFRILHEDKRWKGSPAKMATYVYPGCGFGGYCLPKDTSAICKEAELLGFSPNILKSVLDVNNRIKEFVVDAVVNKFDPEEYLGILGLAFKPNTDDVRESPSRDVIELLIRRGFKKIVAYDPLAIETFKRRYNLNIEYSESLEDLLKKTDNILLLTAWDEFRKKKDMLLRKNALDFRYCLQS